MWEEARPSSYGRPLTAAVVEGRRESRGGCVCPELPTAPLADPGTAPPSLWDWTPSYRAKSWGPGELPQVHEQADRVREEQRVGEMQHGEPAS